MSKTQTSFLVRRTCTRKSDNAEAHESRPFEVYRDQAAYVLLGDPGAGKTESFRREAEESDGQYIRARDFALPGFTDQLQDRMLFIDGLDEMPTVDGDRRHPLDRIRKQLILLGRPRFRLSCREADWLGESGKDALKAVSPDGNIIALHIDPLSDNDITEILEHHPAVSDPSVFMQRARAHGLDELLRNPQTVKLLIEAVGGNTWPQTRTEIFAMACRQLVREQNPEHRVANREHPSSAESVIDAAGYLCSIQLLAGLTGFALDQELSDDQYAFWNDLKKTDLPLLSALKSNLFHGDGEQLRTPIHRTVAEFLGAHYLGLRIEQSGLPISRVLALMAGEDGGIVPDLRGLAAWLSVHSRVGRSVLIERDPLGVVLYGDARDFPAQDKERVLTALRCEAEHYPWFRSDDWASSPFGALGTADMEPTFLQIITSPTRAEADQSLLDCVLDAIRYGERMPSLAEPLEAIVRDTSYWPIIRQSAVRALIQGLQPESSKLLQLAKDIRDSLIEDSEDELLGTLLSELYPGTIPPSEIFDYLHRPKSDHLIGSYFMFWVHYLPEQSANDHLPMLLDKLVKIRAVKEQKLDISRFDRMEGALLARGLEVHGDVISDDRLFAWLALGLEEFDLPRIDEKYAKRVAAWFETRPERYKSLIELAGSQCAEQTDPWSCMQSAVMRLSIAAPPAGIETWYLEKAASETRVEMGEFYFGKAVQPLLQQHGGRGYLSMSELDRLQPWIEANPKLELWLEPFISCRIGDWEQKHALRKQTRDIEQQKKKTELVAFYQKNIVNIRNGTAYPQILHDLALAYNGHLIEARGDTSRERMKDFLGGDLDLIEAVYSGFRHTLDRSDLPPVNEIVELEVKGRMHYIRPACLIGMDHLFRVNRDEALSLPDDVLSRLLVFRLTDGIGDEPQWFDTLARTSPHLVADAFLAYAQPMLRARKEHIVGLHLLTNDNAYIEVARLALPKLLEGFPVRASVKQLPFVLDRLLKGAFHSLSRKDLATLVARKTSLKSMNAAQKVYWLACGLLLMPETYEKELFQFIGKSQKRRAHLAAFLYEDFGRNSWLDWVSIPGSTLARLIELLGPDSQDTQFGGMVTEAMRTADMLRSFINALGNDPGEQASLDIERLLGLPKLSNWHNRLRTAQYNQCIARRKASFRHLTVAEVDCTLAALQPANAADLSALIYEQLRDIARKIRDGGTNDYRQYWSYDSSNKRLEKPKPENDCRDALLSDLQERLGRLNIDAQREGNYADDKRADIRVSFGGAIGFNVPIEIKKDTHNDLWSGMHEQLISKYARDPGADGNGIYLVFWFGGKGMRPPADGKKLHSTTELEERLRQDLSSKESHCIKVCVIDCALPKDKGREEHFSE